MDTPPTPWRWLVVAVLLVLPAALAFAQSFDYPDFASSAPVLQGDAAVRSGRLDLTPPNPGRIAGAAWHAVKVGIGGGFETRIVFSITEPGGQADWLGNEGGDGFAFVIQVRGTDQLGLIGGYLGYGKIAGGLAIEFDAYANEEWPGSADSSSLSIGVHTSGLGLLEPDEATSLGRNDQPPPFDDGRVHEAVIRYDAGRDSLVVELDGARVLSVGVNIRARLLLLDGTAWVGLTAASASAWERHSIYSWCYAAWPDPLCPRPPAPPDSIVPITPPDTVVVRDTIRTRDTLHSIDTLRLTDTLRIHHTDTLRTRDTLTRTDTVRVFDTLAIVVRDTVIRPDTVYHTDTLTITVDREVIVTDTLRLPCYDPWQPLDTVCGGDYRMMSWLEHWLHIESVAPNPASSFTVITFEVEGGDRYRLALYDEMGREVLVIDEGDPGSSGRRRAVVDLRQVPSGRYVLLLRGWRERWVWLWIEK